MAGRRGSGLLTHLFFLSLLHDRHWVQNRTGEKIAPLRYGLKHFLLHYSAAVIAYGPPLSRFSRVMNKLLMRQVSSRIRLKRSAIIGVPRISVTEADDSPYYALQPREPRRNGIMERSIHS